jgi:hypothetical protein
MPWPAVSGMLDAIYFINRNEMSAQREDVMRATINTIIAMIATTTPAFAANAVQADEPGILCWAFAGFCAVIFAGQLVPAVMLMIGAVKALATKPAEADRKA